MFTVREIIHEEIIGVDFLCHLFFYWRLLNRLTVVLFDDPTVPFQILTREFPIGVPIR